MEKQNYQVQELKKEQKQQTLEIDSKSNINAKTNKNKTFKKVVMTICMVLLLFLPYIVVNYYSYAKDSNLKSNELAKVNDETITYEEYNEYVIRGIRYYEEIGGKDIWKAKYNNMMMFDKLKQDILNEMIILKIQLQKVKEYEIVGKDNDEKIEKLKEYVIGEFIVDEEELKKYIEISENNENNLDYLDINEVNNMYAKNENILKYKEEYVQSKKKELYDSYLMSWKEKSKIIVNYDLYNSIKINDYKENY